MRLIEQFIQSKTGNDTLCEDGIFANEHYIAVINGVTSKGKMLWNGRTSGYHAKEILKNALAMLQGTESTDEVLSLLNAQLHQAYGKEVDFFQQQPEERIQATIAIYSRHAQQVWSFGDCQFWIGDQLHTNEMKIDDLLAEVRTLYLNLELLQGKTVADLVTFDPSFEVILPILKKQFLLANTMHPYGYAVLDGFCNDFSRLRQVNVPNGSMVVLATDGYPQCKPNLVESEEALFRLKQTDPLCINEFKSTRGFTNGKVSLDDRAYVRFIT